MSVGRYDFVAKGAGSLAIARLGPSELEARLSIWRCMFFPATSLSLAHEFWLVFVDRRRCEAGLRSGTRAKAKKYNICLRALTSVLTRRHVGASHHASVGQPIEASIAL